MAHITAGDLRPIIKWSESAYGTPTGDPAYYADVSEGGKITPTDTDNQYLSWRYGSRGYSRDNYVTRQHDAGYQGIFEVREAAGWSDIIADAYSCVNRTKALQVYNGSMRNGRKYTGCVTDTLTVSADEPGGIVKFEENVLASTSENYGTNHGSMTLPTNAAVQWLGGAKLRISGNYTTIYPQSFKITISNNLERVRIPGTGGAKTGAIIPGRQEITIDMDIWMDDFAYFGMAIDNGKQTSAVLLTLGQGATTAKQLTLGEIMWMDSNPDFVQDKQKQTLHLRAGTLSIEAPS